MGINEPLSKEEVRILGCLLEKAVVTPDQYPLTLNGLTNACNQKSSREPVMNLEPGAVLRAARGLSDKHLVTVTEGKNVEKFAQRICNTFLSKHKLGTAEYAILCLLMLRGPQTPGELRARSGRLHEFEDNGAVRDVLNAMIAREGGPLVARLPRRAGRQDHEYMHLFFGETESVEEEEAVVQREAVGSERQHRIEALEARVDKLEQALRTLSQSLGQPVDLD